MKQVQSLLDSTINATDDITDFDRLYDHIDLSLLNITYDDILILENFNNTEISITGTDFQIRLNGDGHSLTEEQFLL